MEAEPFSTLELSELGRLDRAQQIQQALSVQRAWAALAREDYNVFASFVLRDEATGERLRQSWAHRDWSNIVNENREAVIIAHVEAGKTWQFSVGRVLWALGKDPNTRIVIASRSQAQAVRIAGAVKSYIANSVELRMVFPHLKRGTKPGDKWTETQLTVERTRTMKEPSVLAFGVEGAITGARVDGFIIDDILDDKNTNTPEMRDAIERKFFRQFMSRRTENAWVYVIGNAWHPDDLYNRLEIMGWPTFRYPVLATEEVIARKATRPVVTPQGVVEVPILLGEPTWPERWHHKRIDKERKIRSPLEFARAYMCIARDDTDARFQRRWVERAMGMGRELGFHRPHFTIEDALDGDQDAADWKMIAPASNAHDPDADIDEEGLVRVARVYTGVDLSTGEGKDLTALVTIMVYPDRVRRILNVETGRWKADEILNKIVETYKRYRSIFMVENVAAQRYIIQLIAKHTSIPIWPFATGKQKADPTYGIDGLAAEYANEKWIVPCGPHGEMDPEIQALCNDMLFYLPKAHTGDRLMAMWFAQQCAERFQIEDDDDADGVGMRIIG